jgi:LAS superfamily LD-carboxypeptidase LdcB
MKKLTTLCYVLALCSCMSCNSQNNTNSKSQASSAASKNKNVDANVLRMQLSSIKDNQVTKGDAVLFLLPQGWKQQSQLDWDAQNTQFPASAYLHVVIRKTRHSYTSIKPHSIPYPIHPCNMQELE